MLEKRLNEAFRSESSPPLEVGATSQGDGYIKIAKQFLQSLLWLYSSTNHNPVHDIITARY